MAIDPRIQSSAEATVEGGARTQQPDAKAGAAFRAVLERLEEKTRALGEASENLDDPSRLGDAVLSARASVEEAVSLGTELIEAYRASSQRSNHEAQSAASDSLNDADQ